MSGGYFDVVHGNYLPEDNDEVIVGSCPECGDDINVGDDVILFDGDYFCDEGCVLSYIGAECKEATL